MHALPFDQQLQMISERANSRQIIAGDRYLEIYPELLNGVQSLLPLTRQNLVLVAHAVFGWMPTQLRVNVTQLDHALNITEQVLLDPNQITVNALPVLASTFQTVRGNSVVAASKVLHFLAPDHFPVWDRLVAKTWGLQASGSQAAANYHGFLQACREFIAHPDGKQACATLRQRLVQAGYSYPMSNMRIIELAFFLP
jgi:hypothetical protein